MAASTTKAQRITIWIIAAMMVFGSVGFYFLIIMQNRQLADEQAQLQQQVQPQPLEGYEAEPFDPESVNKLQTMTLKKGDGKTVKEGDMVSVKYMGWLPSGELFDSSNRGGKTSPISLRVKKGMVIDGWVQGVSGMKEGGVRKLVIPAKLAYGEQGSGSVIPPNTPIAFIIEVIGTREPEQPQQ